MAPSFRPQKPGSWNLVLVTFLVAGLVSLFLFNSGSMMSRIGNMGKSQEFLDSSKGDEVSLPAVKLASAVFPQEAIHLKTRGTVDAGRSSELASNVSGLIEWVNPQFQSGGALAAGDPVIRIAKQMYLAELAEARANWEDAKLAQSEEQEGALKAVRKWDNNPKAKGGRSELVMRLPHRRAMTARVSAAEERMKQAERMVENTTVLAPYDCRVSSRQVDLGMRVSEGDPLGCVFSAKEREMRISLSVEKLRALPRDEKGQICSMGAVSLKSGGADMRWNAQIARVSSQADVENQGVIVIVSIEENPDYLPDFRTPPLNLDLEFEFQAQTTDGLFWIPVSSMVDDSALWVMTGSGELAKRHVRVERSEGERNLVVLLAKYPGDRICLEVPKGARQGMKVRSDSEEIVVANQ